MIRPNLIAILALLSTVALGTVPAMAQTETQSSSPNERTITKRISAMVTKIDPKTREVTLETPLGNYITLTADPAISRFDEFSVGDFVTATYASSISSELRAPTQEELAQPIVEVAADAVATADMQPGAAVGRAIRAVCTIEGMNRITGTIMLKDPDGDFHIIDDVNPEKMEGVALGDTIIINFTEAFALSLEKQPAAN